MRKESFRESHLAALGASAFSPGYEPRVLGRHRRPGRDFPSSIERHRSRGSSDSLARRDRDGALRPGDDGCIGADLRPIPHMDAGTSGARVRGCNREPYRPPSRGDASPGEVRSDLLRRPAERRRAEAHLPAPSRASRPRLVTFRFHEPGPVEQRLEWRRDRARPSCPQLARRSTSSGRSPCKISISRSTKRFRSRRPWKSRSNSYAPGLAAAH